MHSVEKSSHGKEPDDDGYVAVGEIHGALVRHETDRACREGLRTAGHSDELRSQMAEHYQEIRNTVGEMVRASLGEEAESQGADPNVIASFLIAVCDGLLLQWLLDPERTPSGEELVASLGAGLSLAAEAEGAEGAEPAVQARARG